MSILPCISVLYCSLTRLPRFSPVMPVSWSPLSRPSLDSERSSRANTITFPRSLSTWSETFQKWVEKFEVQPKILIQANVIRSRKIVFDVKPFCTETMQEWISRNWQKFLSKLWSFAYWLLSNEWLTPHSEDSGSFALFNFLRFHSWKVAICLKTNL